MVSFCEESSGAEQVRSQATSKEKKEKRSPQQSSNDSTESSAKKSKRDEVPTAAKPSEPLEMPCERASSTNASSTTECAPPKLNGKYPMPHSYMCSMYKQQCVMERFCPVSDCDLSRVGTDFFHDKIDDAVTLRESVDPAPFPADDTIAGSNRGIGDIWYVRYTTCAPICCFLGLLDNDYFADVLAVPGEAKAPTEQDLLELPSKDLLPVASGEVVSDGGGIRGGDGRPRRIRRRGTMLINLA